MSLASAQHPAAGALQDIAPANGRLYLPQLDGVRFLAFMMVFSYHYPGIDQYIRPSFVARNLSLAQSFGWIGVDVFLTLSAFLIFTLLLAERAKNGTIAIRSFYIRRALRIWPLYYAYLLVSFLLPCFDEPGYHLATSLQYHLAPASLYLLNISGMIFPESVPWPLGHMWTISLEEQFYLFIPVLLFFFAGAAGRRIGFTLFSLLVLTIGARTYDMLLPPPHAAVWVSPLCRLDPFIVGGGLAFLYQRRQGGFKNWRGEWLALAAVGLFVLITHYPGLRLSLHTIWQLSADALAGGFLIAAVINPGWIGKVFSWRPFAYLGKISYGLYVYHEICLHYALRFLPNFHAGHTGLNWLLGYGEVLAVTIALSSLSYFCYERHFLKIKRRFERIASRPA